jgi:eukaryotic-like serine/threonine-protein kinase
MAFSRQISARRNKALITDKGPPPTGRGATLPIRCGSSSARPANDLRGVRNMPGELEEFRLVRSLGRGGMGEVYLAYDTVLLRAVAIKLIGSGSSAVRRERFLTEARAIARLSHPNVVTIHRVGSTHDGRLFLVQELIRGESLDRVPRPMPWREVCQLAIGIARGLYAAHRRGILHCDIKPANVMLDDSGVPRLIDFGLARLSAAGDSSEAVAAARSRFEPSHASAHGNVAETWDLPAVGVPDRPRPCRTDLCNAILAGGHRDEPPRAPRSASMGLLGTPRYMAPELWRREPANVPSDLYSLGVMLYELLVGTVPHPQTDREELRRATLSGAVRPIHEVAPDTPAALMWLVMRCLALDPHARPSSAAWVAHELAALLVGARDPDQFPPMT